MGGSHRRLGVRSLKVEETKTWSSLGFKSAIGFFHLSVAGCSFWEKIAGKPSTSSCIYLNWCVGPEIAEDGSVWVPISAVPWIRAENAKAGRNGLGDAFVPVSFSTVMHDLQDGDL